MTVSVKRNKVQYTGDNSTTAFSVIFPYTESSQVKVYLGSTLQTITTHYTLTDPGATGTVTFLTAPGTGVNVSLIRETDYLQGVDYVNNDALDAETLEKAFDKLTMMAQQLDAKIDGSVGFDETVSDSDTTSLKLAAGTTDLAGKLLAFDDSGNFVTTQEIGTFKGSDTTTTTAAYVVRDLIRDSSNDNVYFTKQDAPSGTLLTNTSYFELLVDVATVRTLKVAAETARTGAETAETNAAASLASFQGQYKTGSSDPYSGSADAGDLWYDTSASILKYYTGSAFEPVTTSLATVTDNYLTISNQVITAGTVPISLGGTGATTASGARTALGVDAAGTDNSTDVTLAGSLDYLTISGQAITRNAIDLTTDVTGALPVANGGTGSATASDARTALGLQIGVNTQAFNQALTDISNLAVTNGNFIVGDGTNWVAESGATARASLGLTIGTNVQAQNSNLNDLSGISFTGRANQAIVINGTADGLTTAHRNVGALTSVTISGDDEFSILKTVASGSTGDSNTFSLSLNAANTRTHLGLGTLATQDTITESQISDLQSYLTAEANDLSAAVTWVNVPDANITQSSVTQHQAALSITESQISDLQTYLTASSTAALTNKSGNISQWANDSGYLTAETNDLGTAVTGTLGTANGGTGLTTIGTAGQVLKVNTGATALEFADESGGGGSGSSYIEHSSTVSDSLAISSNTNRMYIGNTTFSGSGSGTMAGYLVISHGYANFTGTVNVDTTGTLRIVG